MTTAGIGTAGTNTVPAAPAASDGDQGETRLFARLLAVVRRRTSAAGLIVAVATAIGMLSTYWTYHQIFPDTQYYILWTLRMLGHSRADSEQIVHQFVAQHAVFKPYDSLWGWTTGVQQTRPRVLLPVLSIPFVWLFGPAGICVVPGMAYGVYAWATYRVCRIHVSARAACVVMSVAVLSVPMLHWGVGGLTDSLALAGQALLLLAMPWQVRATRRTLVWIVVVAALAGLARLMSPFALLAVGGLWLWSRRRAESELRRSWTWAFVATIVGAGASTVFTAMVGGRSFSQNLEAQTRTHTLREASSWLVHHLPHVFRSESWIVLGDPALLIVIGLAVVALVVDRTRLSPWLIAGGLGGFIAITIANPAMTEFRYEMPAMPMICLAAALAADRWLRKPTDPPLLERPALAPSV
jgi:hypothetical protein